MSEDQERSLIEFSAPGKWRDLKDAVRAMCSELPFDLRIEEEAHTLTVKRIHNNWIPKVLYLRFDQQTSRILWKCCDPFENGGEITFGVSRQSVFYVVSGINRPLREIVVVLTSCVTGEC